MDRCHSWSDRASALVLSASVPAVAFSFYSIDFVWSKAAVAHLFLLAALCLSVPWLRKERLARIVSPDFLLLLALAVWAGLSASWAEVPAKSLKLATMLNAGVAGFGLSKLALGQKRMASPFLLGSLTAGALVSGYGILQYAFNTGLFRMTLNGAGMEDAGTTFGLSNFTVDVLVLVLPLGVGMALSRELRSIRCFGGVTFLLILGYVAVSQVRAGQMSVVAMAAFFLSASLSFRRDRGTRKRMLSLFAASVLAVGLLVGLTAPGQKVLETFRSSFDLEQTTIKIRLHTWRHSLEIIKDSPLLGVGLGNYEVVSWRSAGRMLQEKTLSSNTRMDRTHNEYLNITSDLGGVGLLLFLLFLGLLFHRSLRFLAKRAESRSFWIVLALSTGLVGELVNACFSFPLQMPGSLHLFFLTAGTLSGLVDGAGAGTQASSRRGHEMLKYAGLSLALVTVLFALSWSVRFCLAELAYREGQSLNSRGKYSEALRAYERGLDYEPFAERVFYERAFVLARLGRIEEAVSSMASCLDQSPYFGKARKEYAMMLADAGRPEEALTQFGRALATQYSRASEIYLYRASLYLRRSQLESALTEILAALRHPSLRDVRGNPLNVLEQSILSISRGQSKQGEEGKGQTGFRGGVEEGNGSKGQTGFRGVVDKLVEMEKRFKGEAPYWYIRALFELRLGQESRAQDSLIRALDRSQRAGTWIARSPDFQRLLADRWSR
ncbi:MAG: O-antigen ligase family protein [Acidobacteriota bacterium]